MQHPKERLNIRYVSYPIGDVHIPLSDSDFVYADAKTPYDANRDESNYDLPEPPDNGELWDELPDHFQARVSERFDRGTARLEAERGERWKRRAAAFKRRYGKVYAGEIPWLA